MNETYKINDFVQIRITPQNRFIWDKSYHRYSTYKSGIFQIIGYNLSTKLYLVCVRESEIERWAIEKQHLTQYGAEQKWLGSFAFAVYDVAFGGKSKYECICANCEIYDVGMMKRYAEPKVIEHITEAA